LLYLIIITETDGSIDSDVTSYFEVTWTFVNRSYWPSYATTHSAKRS